MTDSRAKDIKRIITHNLPSAWYGHMSRSFPEDFIESRTSWDDMRDYADSMEYVLNSIMEVLDIDDDDLTTYFDKKKLISIDKAKEMIESGEVSNSTHVGRYAYEDGVSDHYVKFNDNIGLKIILTFYYIKNDTDRKQRL